MCNLVACEGGVVPSKLNLEPESEQFLFFNAFLEVLISCEMPTWAPSTPAGAVKSLQPKRYDII